MVSTYAGMRRDGGGGAARGLRSVRVRRAARSEKVATSAPRNSRLNHFQLPWLRVSQVCGVLRISRPTVRPHFRENSPAALIHAPASCPRRTLPPPHAATGTARRASLDRDSATPWQSVSHSTSLRNTPRAFACPPRWCGRGPSGPACARNAVVAAAWVEAVADFSSSSKTPPPPARTSAASIAAQPAGHCLHMSISSARDA